MEFNEAELVCADPDGMPFIVGDEFYEWLVKDNCCKPVTAFNYLNLVLTFLTYIWKCNPSIRYIAPSKKIRIRVREYLIDKLSCQVRPHRNGNYMVRTSVNSPQSARLFLTALKRFYEFVVLHKRYKDTNPMVWTSKLAKEFKPKMPPMSGMTLPVSEKGRMPETYYCIVGGDWKPHILDDPDIPQKLLPKFSIRRDFIITMILFQSGARISEVLDLTIGDWRSCNKGNRAKAKNKGSNGERVKEIWWDSETTELLRRYINRERYDKQMRGLDELSDSDRIFVTDEGDALSYMAFYTNWRRACQRAGLQITPHQVRHWYVTMALHKFAGHPDEQREEERQSLIAYLGWKNPNTIQAYDHHIRAKDFGPAHEAISQLSKPGKKTTRVEIGIQKTPSNPGNLTQEDYEFIHKLQRR
jgi:integrase